MQFTSRKIHRRTLVCSVAIVLLFATRVHANTITLNFDSLQDSTPLTNQYSSSGITFTDATVLSAGISLNELDFPPHSGTNVVVDDSGPITLTFTSPASFVGAYFTYIVPLTIDAFNLSGQMIAISSSAFSANDVSSGNSPNEFLSVSGQDIARVTITGDPLGGSFAMDDLSFTTPEPPTPMLLGIGYAALVMMRSAIKYLKVWSFLG